MASEAAKAVAQEVLETLGRGQRPVLRKIAVKKGYAPNTADSPKIITETKSYQSVVNPVVQQMEEERIEILKRLKVTRSKAKYRDLIDGLDKLTKNIQLLTGGSTSNVALGIKRLSDVELERIADGK